MTAPVTALTENLLQSSSDDLHTIGRVKSVDFDNKTLLLTSHSTGHVVLWNLETQSLAHCIKVSEGPVRCARFFVNSTVVAGCDGGKIVLLDCAMNTMSIVQEWTAHSDYVRFIAVNCNRRILLSTSDDMTIKVWNYEDGSCSLRETLKGHCHYVMQVQFNPKESNKFATASLDHRVGLWTLIANNDDKKDASYPLFLEGHQQGVNCVGYDPSADTSFLLSGSDDLTVKLWNYQTQTLIHTFSGRHFHNVTALVVCNGELASVSQDGILCLWNLASRENVASHNFSNHGYAWALNTSDNNMLAIGFDKGCIGMEWGNVEPKWSFIVHGGGGEEENDDTECRMVQTSATFCSIVLVCVGALVFIGIMMWQVLIWIFDHTSFQTQAIATIILLVVCLRWPAHRCTPFRNL